MVERDEQAMQCINACIDGCYAPLMCGTGLGLSDICVHPIKDETMDRMEIRACCSVATC
jgi:hypothetical protein